MHETICIEHDNRHSGMDAEIQRPGMAIFGLLRAISSAKVSPPCVLDTGNPCRYDGLTYSIFNIK